MLAALLLLTLAPAQDSPFDVHERSIPEIQRALERGQTTSVELVRQYLRRIEAYDLAGPELRSVVHVSPHM